MSTTYGMDQTESHIGWVNMNLTQTPKQALSTWYFRINVVLSGLINFGINYGFAYWLLHQYDTVGIWEEPDTPNADGTALWFDWLITTFLLAFLSALMSNGGIQKEVEKGNLKPIADATFNKGCLRFFPTRVRNVWVRSLFIALQYMLIFWGPSMILLVLVCHTDTFDGDASSCYMGSRTYFWFKSIWCFFLALFCYPIIFLSSLNRRSIPDEIYDKYLAQHEQVDEVLYLE